LKGDGLRNEGITELEAVGFYIFNTFHLLCTEPQIVIVISVIYSYNY